MNIAAPIPAPYQSTTPEPACQALVLDRDFPDPSLLHTGKGYYAYATNSRGVHVQAAFSEDLRTWEYLGEVLPELPGWAAPRFGFTWSPYVLRRPDGLGYVLYFVTRWACDERGVQAIGVATSLRPEGPFLPEEDCPFLCQREAGGSIDPSVFQDEDGSLYLVWKNDGNALQRPTWIHLQRLAEDGLSLLGHPVRLLTADQPWEGCVVEGPSLWKRCGEYFLFYSANDFTRPDYGVGAAVAYSPWGPYRKIEPRVLKSDLQLGWIGPGGQDVIRGPDGEAWLVFHGWRPGRYRAMHALPLEWVADRPVVRIKELSAN